MNALTRALDDSGLSQAELAALISVTPQAVNRWARGGQIPAARCPAIEAATGAPCEDLRPDVIWTRDDDGRITGYFTLLAANDDLPLPPGAPTAPAHHAPNGAN